jgi:hypothetical protein
MPQLQPNIQLLFFFNITNQRSYFLASCLSFISLMFVRAKMTLCDLCQRILTLDPSDLKDEDGPLTGAGWQTAYTHTFLSLMSSMEKKCYFCYRVHRDLSQQQLDILEKLPEIEIRCSMWWEGQAYDEIEFELVSRNESWSSEISLISTYRLLPSEGQ